MLPACRNLCQHMFGTPMTENLTLGQKKCQNVRDILTFPAMPSWKLLGWFLNWKRL